MNDFHLINLANATISERRAEADRHRLVHSANSTQSAVGTASHAARQSSPRPRFGLASLFGRLAPR